MADSPGDLLARQVKVVGAATMLLFAVVCALTFYVYHNQQNENRSVCRIERALTQSQVASYTNLVASSHEFATHETTPELRSFFHNSEAQRRVALGKAQVRLAQLNC